MRDKLKTFNDLVRRIVVSPRFFYVVVALLTVEAAWIALTARYPQAFDENYHFGLIQLHAQQWLPFFTSQPPDSGVYGALARDPSYLFHFLLSLPYRVLSILTSSEMAQVIALRFINIGIFVAGLFVYRRLFDEIRISVAMRNAVLFFFVLLPVVPLLAGQINYDNLMFLFSGLIFIYLGRYVQYMRNRTPTSPLVPTSIALQVVLIGSLGSVVKFAFAPIFLAAVVILLVSTVFYYHLSRIKPKSFKLVFNLFDKRKLVILAVCVVIGLGLCFERYGVNVLQYHDPVPDCGTVLSIDECQAYSPWARDYLFANTYARPPLLSYVVYPFVWLWRMVFETMFTITSSTDQPGGLVSYYAYAPLRIAYVASLVATAGGLIGALAFWRRIRRNRPLAVILGVAAFYTAVLFAQNFSSYHHTGEAVAIHGRYLVAVYPVLLLCLAIGWHGLLGKTARGRYEAIVLVALTLLFLQGGGITVWLVKSNSSWYWQNNAPAADANAAVKTVLDKVIYHQP